jgi:thiosulfate sulfurtransferase
MTQFTCISIPQALELIEEGAVIADIRDPQSYASGHIRNAVHLSNDNLEQTLSQWDFETPIIVCCYHGISSQNAAAFLADRGFENVTSLNGGFEEWRTSQPDYIEPTE